MLAVDTALALHQVEHALRRVGSGDVEVLVEAERQPSVGDPGDRRAQLQVLAEVDRDLRAFERALDRRARYLAVALRRVAVADREQRTVDRHREIERRAG